MDPHPRPPETPDLSSTLGVGQIEEGLAGEERTPHERHRPLHPRLVLRLDSTSSGAVAGGPRGWSHYWRKGGPMLLAGDKLDLLTDTARSG